MSDSRDAFNTSAAAADPIVWDHPVADGERPSAWTGPGAFDPPATPASEPAPAGESASEQVGGSSAWAGAAPTAERVHDDWQSGRTQNPQNVQPVDYDTQRAEPVAAASVESAPVEPTPQPAATPPAAPANPEPEPDDALTIGRGRTNSIVLDDMLVSRQHVRITADDEGLVLEDLGSRNGTFVNGRRVARTHLHEGDRIGIGGSTFEVRDGWLVTI